ncbi:HipA N-terminal domain-containing protein [uncultured Flavobacterium sp.]|uniref:HipA N-terminal domain-containing protein n=1 Tax=uncultured Flavobacterium sp. TaxID=165435 RepID=UPI0030CA2B10
MNRNGNVYLKHVFCGIVSETDSGYLFEYNKEYLKNDQAQAVSLTLPLTEKPYQSKTLFAFFDGLIPEGWLLDIAERNWKINYKDRMGLLLSCCKDCIGAVSVENNNEKL